MSTEIQSQKLETTMYDFGIRKQKIVREQEVEDTRYKSYSATHNSHLTNQEQYWRGSWRGWGGSRDYGDGITWSVRIPEPGMIVFTVESRWRDGHSRQHSNAVQIYCAGGSHAWSWGGWGYGHERDRERSKVRAAADSIASSFGWPNFIREELRSNIHRPQHIFWYYHHCEYDVNGRKFVFYKPTPAYPNPVANDR